jgi:sugar O-acyltransferase (sialic acid O-acetyltransferase NeuD family)
VILWGAGSQSKLIIRYFRDRFKLGALAMVDPYSKLNELLGFPVYRNLEDVDNSLKDLFHIAIGNHYGMRRVRYADLLTSIGCRPISLVHPDSWIHSSSTLEEGILILPKAIVANDVLIGCYTVLNHACLLDHESIIGNGVHIMPGACIAGRVQIGNYSAIGTNSTVLPDVKIGSNTIVGAGSIVTKDLPDNVIAYGSPAKVKRANHVSEQIYETYWKQ